MAKSYTHNLVNTLYAMKELLETCLNRREGESPSLKSQAVLERVCGQADQALQIAKRLSSFHLSKESEGSGRQTRARASVQQTWQRAAEDLGRDREGLNGMEIIERIPEPFPSLQCDSRDLQEIFYHLAKNAFQAMGGTGKFIIRVQLSFSTKEEPFASLQIADTGPGIPESRLPYLFLPFFSTKSPKEGNGLGLYLTRQLVTRNGGRITVSSFKGTGTTFLLEFPLAKRDKR